MQIKTKNVHLTDEVRPLLLSGALKVAQVVGTTLGPAGSNVIIEIDHGVTAVTKDGVTVAKHLKLDNPVENLAAQIVIQAASKTASKAGDGTTTATVLTAALLKNSQKLLAASVSPIEIKRRYEALLKQSLQILPSYAKDVSIEKLREIATVSANNDEEIGDLITKAYEYVGKNGLISLEESKTANTTLELVDGVAIKKGFSSPYFITNADREEAILENPLVFITTAKLRYAPELIPLLETAIRHSRPLLIIADEVDSQALQLLVNNKLRGNIKVCAIAAPSYGENRLNLLQDIAALCSAQLHLEDSAQRIEDVSEDSLGEARRVIVSKESTLLVEPSRDEDLIAQRASQIQSRLSDETLDAYTISVLQRRLADLTAKVALLRVGAATETEMKERKDRVDDALRATSCALIKGYTIGGGTTLARLSRELKISNDLIDPAFIASLREPLALIAKNALFPPEVVLDKVLSSKDKDFGFNARTLKYSSLEKDGVIDPILVIEEALVNAVSAANMIIISQAAITNKDRANPFDPDPHGTLSI